MKVLFTADWHIKLGQKNVPKDWQINRFKLFFKDLEILSKTIDLIIIGGDIFDRVPTLEELQLFFDYCALAKTLHCKQIIYSGNHEAIKKDTTFLSLLRNTISTLSDGKIRLVDEFETIEDIDFIPYNRLKKYTPQDIDFHSRILCTHVRGEIPPHVQAEVPLELFQRWDIVLAGDLHSHSNTQRNIVYPGSPMTTCFHREEVDTGVVIIDTSTLDWKFIGLHLPQLIRKTVTDAMQMVPTDFNHTIYEIEGDITNLSKVQSHELLDKKIVKRDSESTLRLDKSMDVKDELFEYLMVILNLDEEQSKKVVGKLNDIVKDTRVE